MGMHVTLTKQINCRLHRKNIKQKDELLAICQICQFTFALYGTLYTLGTKKGYYIQGLSLYHVPLFQILQKPLNSPRSSLSMNAIRIGLYSQAGTSTS